MKTSQWANDQGVCLTELMISLTVGAVVLAACLETFNVFHAQSVRQRRSLAQQQEVRIGLEVFEQEIRLASTGALLVAAPDKLQFTANVNAQHTTITGAALPGQTALAVLDGSGWVEGKSVTVCGWQACETHRLARAGQRHQLTLAEPLGLALPTGASVEVTNRILYYTKTDDDGRLELMRMVDGGASVLIAGLKDLRFTYWTNRGNSTAVPSEVNRVVMTLLMDYSLGRVVTEVSLRS